ncbi:divalent-cation tolerance protein CutA [Alkalilimnicola ehrlichii]|uniref:Divalent-cation tolerance protein CutA n=1 Tax=Alkalilimnicola ehrlichii TaxID=351052 RepID=A0A3E0WZP2_9GAMM|nr:divalent-cation tolerance protein CutA [Alkalilimnicola ehrlichii]RFA30127.1 divalent-cation tolerance protein CutA [Alkalilimnicola ehrlichii]RFA37475.1 divalent-cation tolerance protein CutA [Alkalilimnicola ehrlichii]
MDSEHLIVLCTCPDRATAEEIANTLVEYGHAACVNIIPGIVSVYEWQGQVEHGEELQLLAKTTKQAYRKVEETIQRLHPYELPEIVAVPLVKGLNDYLTWISIQTSKHRQAHD